jgi:hypothetical protein
MPMMKAIMQVGMKPGFCKFKVTEGMGNKKKISQYGNPVSQPSLEIFSHANYSYQQ